MKKYNVGIIGFGFIGKVHAYGYINIPMYYNPIPLSTQITHICTSREETARNAVKLIGAKTAVTDFREITENPDIDIVHICTPNHLHKEALLSAMQHNKHIYCDKPLVSNINEAKEIQEAMANYKSTAQMTLQNRFFPATMRAKQLISEGFVGKVLEFRACYLHSGNANPDAPLKWKLSSKHGGGVIADLASHILDLIYYLVGDYDSIITAVHTAYPERPSADDPSIKLKVDAEDCVMILTKMASGALGNIEATKIATGSEDEVRFEIHGSKGALRFNGMDTHYLDAYNFTSQDKPIGGIRGWTRIHTGQRYPSPSSGFPGPKFSIGWIRGHMACLANFLQSIAEEKPGNPGLDQGIYIQHLIECVRSSINKKTWVKV